MTSRTTTLSQNDENEDDEETSTGEHEKDEPGGTDTSATHVHWNATRPFIVRWDATQDLPEGELALVQKRLEQYRTREGTLLPDPDRWASSLCLGIVEALSGLRPILQAQRWLIPSLYRFLRDQSALTPLAIRSRNGGRQPRYVVIGTSTCRIKPWVVEVLTKISSGGRIIATSVRLEGYHGRWVATAIDILAPRP